jgi:hypothetical protein
VPNLCQTGDGASIAGATYGHAERCSDLVASIETRRAVDAQVVQSTGKGAETRDEMSKVERHVRERVDARETVNPKN